MTIVNELDRRGIKVWLMGGKVRVFPKLLLTGELKQMVLENRSALVEELTRIEASQPKPFFNRVGDLVIPFNSPQRYHWWAGGQSVKETILEITQIGGEHGNY